MRYFSFYTIMFLCLFTLSCKNESPIKTTCDFENTDGQYFKLLGDVSLKIKTDNIRVSDASHSGQFSIKLTHEHQYGFTGTLNNVQENEYIYITVWRKSQNGKGAIVVSAENSKEYYESSEQVYEKGKDGWEKLAIEAYIPPNISGKKISFYLWNSSNQDVYFDDLQFFYGSEKKYITYKQDSSLNINFSKKANKKLMNIRKKALLKGILQPDDKDYIKVNLSSSSNTYDSEARLKGDWTDHLNGKKWSFRFRTKGDNYWKGMRTFSIQAPISRDFLNEWVAHKFFTKEDVLTTRYGFVPVSINDQNLGIYAYEEHFDKQLIESQNRREGPILKLDESLFWEFQYLSYLNGEDIKIPFFLSADILPFGLKKILGSKTLYNEFIIAQNLLYQYKKGFKSASDVFDVEKLAKFYAIVDLTDSYHALAWHNLRFYYNPVTSRLEPIAYDCFTENGPFDWVKAPYVGMINADWADRASYFIMKAFTDKAFVKYYNLYLQKYSTKEYINSFFDEISDELKYNENFIKTDYAYYNYDTNFVKNRAKNIRDNFKERIVNTNDKNFDFNFSEKLEPRLYKILLKAYTQTENKFEKTLRIFSYIPEKVAIIGFGKDKNSISDTIDVKIDAFSDTIEYKDITVNKEVKFIFYKTLNMSKIKKKRIYDWPFPKNISPREMIDNSIVYKKYFSKKNDSILVYNTIKTPIKETILIPVGYKVIFNSGSKLDLIGHAGFISYSPVYIYGTSENPVLIKSSDSTGNGFSVISTKQKSEINYAIIDGMNTLDFNGWTLTGSLCFYESNIEMNNSKIINNQCEDALNIVRSKFNVKNTEFRNINSDAFDADFSNGVVSNCSFYNIGNDAIDFSGSQVEIDGLIVDKAGDKGVSGGENSKIFLKNIDINNANIGIMSKDLSELNASDIKIKNCKYGFVLLQKKPEYGSANIKAVNTVISNTTQEYLIEKGSILFLNGKEIIGKNIKLADIFYK